MCSIEGFARCLKKNVIYSYIMCDWNIEVEPVFPLEEEEDDGQSIGSEHSERSED